MSAIISFYSRAIYSDSEYSGFARDKPRSTLESTGSGAASDVVGYRSGLEETVAIAAGKATVPVYHPERFSI